MLSLLMPFFDQSKSYAYGFEAGKIFGEMECNRRVIEGTFNEENHQQLLLCAKTNNYKVLSITDLGDGWINLRFKKSLLQWLLDFLPFNLTKYFNHP